MRRNDSSNNNHHHHRRLLLVVIATFVIIPTSTMIATPSLTYGANLAFAQPKGNNNNNNIPGSCPEGTIDYNREKKWCILLIDVICEENGFILNDEANDCFNPTTGQHISPVEQCPEGTERTSDESAFCQTGPGRSSDSNRNIPTTHLSTLRFDPDTGAGFISKGKLEGALKVTDAEFQEAVNNGDIRIAALSQVTWRLECSEGIRDFDGSTIAVLTYQLVRNNQGQVTGIQITGYADTTDPFQLEGGPGDVCSGDFIKVEGVTEFEVTHVFVNIIGLGSVQMPT